VDTPNEYSDKRISQLVRCIRDDNEIVSQAHERIREAKLELQVLLRARGENWSDEAGYARIVSAGHRISYLASELDELIISDPLRYGWLKDYRTESPVPEHIQVK
jgi:hypothetical protein